MRNFRKIDNQKFQGDLKIQLDSLIAYLENVESLSDTSVQTITKTWMFMPLCQKDFRM